MIRFLLVGLWASLVTIAVAYATTQYRQTHPATPQIATPAPILETRKTKEINVPKIRNGIVKGYIVTQFSYVVNNAEVKSGPSPDVFIVDEAFRAIYDDEKIDFEHLEKVDINAFAKSLINNVNVRLQAQVVTDIAFQEFTFVANTPSP